MSINKSTTVTIGHSESYLDRRERLLASKTKRSKPITSSHGVSVPPSLWDYYSEKLGV